MHNLKRTTLEKQIKDFPSAHTAGRPLFLSIQWTSKDGSSPYKGKQLVLLSNSSLVQYIYFLLAMTQFRPFANPAPLGLSSFALTTFVLSLHNGGMGQMLGGPPNVVVGLAFFYGGVCQLLAGMWEFANNNTFGATAFSSYGGFWMGYAALLVPGFGIMEGLEKGGGSTVPHALGIFLLGWVIMTFILFLATLRTNLGLCTLFALLEITFILLCAGEWTGKLHVTQAGGYFGLFTSLAAWYVAASDLIGHHNSFFILPNPSLAPKESAIHNIEDPAEQKFPDGS